MLLVFIISKLKSNLHYTRRVTPKRVTSGGAHLRGLAPGQHSTEETSQRWRVVEDSNTAPKKRHNDGESLKTLCRFDRPGNRTVDLPHRWCALSN